jgi:hypothetical protein
MKNSIAQVSMLGTRPGEKPFQITVEIGTPYQCGTDPEEWACPVAVSPLFEKLHDAHGGDSFQALCLAAALAQDLLHGFIEKGGLLSYDTGEAFPLESYAFGIARRV